MKREEKDALIEQLKTQIQSYSHFYLTDAADLNAQDVSDLRRKCFEQDIKMVVVKTPSLSWHSNVRVWICRNYTLL